MVFLLSGLNSGQIRVKFKSTNKKPIRNGVKLMKKKNILGVKSRLADTGLKVYDISMTIEPDMPVYKGRKEMAPRLVTLFSHDSAGNDQSDNNNQSDSNHQSSSIHQSEITMNIHTGTHIDAPLHMIKEGAKFDYFTDDDLLTPCQVLDMSEIQEKITAADLEKLDIRGGNFILLKTRNSDPGFLEDNPEKFIYLEESGARMLAELEPQPAGVGIDALGIERDQPGHPSHRALLKKKIIILEGLRLKKVPEGFYTLLLAPLKFKTTEGAPARAFLLEES